MQEGTSEYFFLKRLLSKLDTGIADSDSCRTPLGLIAPEDKVIDEFVFGNEIRGYVEVLDKHAHGAGVTFLSSLAHARDLESLESFLMPIGFVPPILFHDFLLGSKGLKENVSFFP